MRWGIDKNRSASTLSIRDIKSSLFANSAFETETFLFCFSHGVKCKIWWIINFAQKYNSVYMYCIYISKILKSHKDCALFCFLTVWRKLSRFNYKIMSMKLIEWHAAKTPYLTLYVLCEKTLFYVHINIMCW